MTVDASLAVSTIGLGLLGVALFFLLLRRLTPKPVLPTPPPKPAAKQKEVPKGPPCKIFYGSQTGTAESFATKLAKMLKTRGMAPTCVDMEDYHADDMEDLAHEPYVIFLVATHGEGDPTDNAIGFYEWISSKEREQDDLKDVKFSVFGLGNKQYEHYNSMGRNFNSYMEKLGGTRIGVYGEGDDDVALEDDYQAWLEENVSIIATHFTGADCGASEGPADPEYILQDHGEYTDTAPPTPITESTESVIDKQPWLPASLTAIRELQDKDKSGRSTLHVEVSAPPGTDYTSGPYAYVPGDHIGVRAENNPKMVAALGARLGCHLNNSVTLKAKPGSVCGTYRFPSPCLVRDALGKYLDICTPPHQDMLNALAQYAGEPDEKEALLKLAKFANKELYHREITASCLTVLEVLDKFPSLKPPLSAMLEVLPRLSTRLYSISSSPKQVSNAIHLTVAVVRYGADGATGDREGVASTWFERMRDGREMQIFMRTSDFHLPKDVSKPVVMVGPGTGLAPFRGFIQERQEQRRAGAKGIGRMAMLFGCRSKSYDYIYQNDLESAEADGTISNLLVAFSRDQKEKVYVQNLLEKNASTVFKMLHEEEGAFYICGDAAAMATDVLAALAKSVFAGAGKLSAKEAEDYIQKMKDEGRFGLDVWA